MMAKKLTTILLTALLAFTLPLTALARGVYDDENDYSYTTGLSFRFDTGGEILVFGKEAITDIDYDEIWTGSELYIPIFVYDEDNDREGLATDKQIKDFNVTVSYKATSGGQYIKDVTIVNGKKSKIGRIPAGMYAKVTFVDAFNSTRASTIDAMIVLSVNNKSSQETRVNLACRLTNYYDEIDGNSAYTVKGPATFEVDDYNGEVTFDFGNKLKYHVRVSRGAKYYLQLDRTPNEDIDAMYGGDKKTYLEYYNFLGDKDKFPYVGRLDIPIDRNKFVTPDGKVQVYVYQVVDDQLKSLGRDILSYNRSTSIMTLRTDSLDEYVLANRALMQNVYGGEEDIIQTGYASAAAWVDDDLLSDTAPQASGQAQYKAPAQQVQTPAQAPSGTLNKAADVTAKELEEELDNAQEEEEEPETELSRQAMLPVVREVVPEAIRADNESSHNPSTGDYNKAGAALAVLVLSGGLCVACSLRKKREKQGMNVK